MGKDYKKLNEWIQNNKKSKLNNEVGEVSAQSEDNDIDNDSAGEEIVEDYVPSDLENFVSLAFVIGTVLACFVIIMVMLLGGWFKIDKDSANYAQIKHEEKEQAYVYEQSEKDFASAESAHSSENSNTKDAYENKSSEFKKSQNLEDESNKLEYNFSEVDMQSRIHVMANSIVLADRKYGELTITMDRIDQLLDQLDKNEYKHEDTYLSILNRWKAGDFSLADKDHNAVWKLLGGEIGKAYGVDWDTLPGWAD